MRKLFFTLFLFVICTSAAAAQQPVSQEKIAAFKQAMQKSKDQLKSYEWIETMTVMVKGDVKSQKQNRCYYSADGSVQKVEINATPQSQPSGGRLKRKIVAKKTGEMTEYMKKAVELIHMYVPPSPEMIQSAKDNNKVTSGVMEPNKVIQLAFKNIVRSGDLMSATLDVQNNQVLDISVSSWVESEKDAVMLKVGFSTLPDGTSFAGETTLDAKSKNIKVQVTNTGHHKAN